MVQASITPLAETQRVAVLWLSRYFELYGDDSPNSDQVLIQVLLKKSVYDLYVKGMQMQGNRHVIELNRFYEIWNVLFPKRAQKTAIL
jgi:hypothetical protein